MKHKRFAYKCPACKQTGLQRDDSAPMKVRVCDECKGRGAALMTVAERIDQDERMKRVS